MRILYVQSLHDADVAQRAVIARICTLMSELIELPEAIEIELQSLQDHEYAHACLDHRFRQRIRINCNLSARDIMPVLVHELIHVHQLHTQQLRVLNQHQVQFRGAVYELHDDLSYDEYLQLPWEQDCYSQQSRLLKEILALSRAKSDEQT